MFRSFRKDIVILMLSMICNMASAQDDPHDGYIIPHGSPVNIIHMSDLLNVTSDHEAIYNTLRHYIINEGEKYLIDTAGNKSFHDTTQARNAVQKLFGIVFDQDRLLVSRYKGQMLYTPYNKNDDIELTDMIEKLDEIGRKTDENPVHQYRDRAGSDMGEQASLQHMAFYINMFHPISEEECTFPVSYKWSKAGTANFCENGNISLIYRVNWERSLQHSVTTGVATPDAKIVRITLDDDVSGAGIHLNNKLNYRATKPGYTGVNSWYRDWSTDAYAQSYSFSVGASNDKASILKTMPSSNVNPQYERTESSGFTLGVSGEFGTESATTGNAKALLIPQATYQQSHSLSFNTKEYSIQKATPSDREVQFIWERSEYSSRKSLLSKKSSMIFDSHVTYPVDISKISPIGYSNFTPKFDVIYKARSNETGTTRFFLDATVQMRPLYTGAFLYFYVFAAHMGYKAFETDDLDRRITAHAGFTVDWDHSIFIGGRPVNLQLGGFNNLCLSGDDEFNVSAQTCSLISKRQAFIYDSMGRYLSALDTSMCLDGNDLTRLVPCDARLSQRWQWLEGSDNLQNVLSYDLLAHETETAEIFMQPLRREDDTDTTTSMRMLTTFTNIHNIPYCHHWQVSPNNMGKIDDIYFMDDTATGETDYFRLLTPVYDSYPSSSDSNNNEWEYLGKAMACQK